MNVPPMVQLRTIISLGLGALASAGGAQTNERASAEGAQTNPRADSITAALPFSVRLRGSPHSSISRAITRSARRFRPTPPTSSGVEAKEYELVVRRVRVRAGDQLKDLLQREHVLPNGDALSVVYNLNPDLKNADDLQVGRDLLIPSAKVSDQGDMRPADGATIVVEADSSGRDSVVMHADSISATAAAAVAAAGPELSRAERRAALAAFETVSSSLKSVSEAAIPLSGEALEQVQREGAAVAAISQRSAQGESPLTQEDVRVVRAAASDLMVKQATAVRAMNTVVSVEINTFASDGTPRRNLQVFVVPHALASDPGARRPLAVVSSPARDQLPEADYDAWAEDAAGRRVTNVKLLKVRRAASDKPFTADLLVQ